jgi:hypothetical protein
MRRTSKLSKRFVIGGRVPGIRRGFAAKIINVITDENTIAKIGGDT